MSHLASDVNFRFYLEFQTFSFFSRASFLFNILHCEFLISFPSFWLIPNLPISLKTGIKWSNFFSSHFLHCNWVENCKHILIVQSFFTKNSCLLYFTITHIRYTRMVVFFSITWSKFLRVRKSLKIKLKLLAKMSKNFQTFQPHSEVTLKLTQPIRKFQSDYMAITLKWIWIPITIMLIWVPNKLLYFPIVMSLWVSAKRELLTDGMTMSCWRIFM